MWQLCLEPGFGMALTEETGTCSSLVRRVHAVPLGGMKGVCWGVICCAQLVGGKHPVPLQMGACPLSGDGSF